MYNMYVRSTCEKLKRAVTFETHKAKLKKYALRIELRFV